MKNLLRSTTTALIAGACTLTGCTATEAPTINSAAKAEETRQDIAQTHAAIGEEPPSLLQIDIRDITAIGRTVRVRGSVINGHEQAVEGVQYRLRLFNTEGDRTLRAEYDEDDHEIEPGASAPFNFEIESMYFATAPRLLVDAIPLKVGDSAFAEPDDWAP